MEDLIKSVQNLASQEYDRAAVKFGLMNHSDHESYSVIKEELESVHKIILIFLIISQRFLGTCQEQRRR